MSKHCGKEKREEFDEMYHSVPLFLCNNEGAKGKKPHMRLKEREGI